jgi:hypothetical protein
MDNAGAAESSPTPQPNFVPFKSIASRKAQSKGVSLSTSTEQGPAADAEGIVHDQPRQSIGHCLATSADAFPLLSEAMEC